MALTKYLKLKGANQGDINGDCKQKGREKMILVYSLDHQVEIPRDTHSGMPTGQRIHHPLTILKHKDQASPLLFQACCTGEQISEFELDFYRIDEKGQEKHYYTIKLERAIIVNLTSFTPATFLPENQYYHDMEKVSFSYEKMIWTYEPDGIEAEDDWRAPKS